MFREGSGEVPGCSRGDPGRVPCRAPYGGSVPILCTIVRVTGTSLLRIRVPYPVNLIQVAIGLRNF